MKKLLIVDDTEQLLYELKDIMTMEGYDVTTAATAIDGLEVLDDNIDLILTDITMPGMDGFEFIDKVKSENEELPIVVISAKTDEASIAKALDLGAEEYLKKPCSIEKLSATIENIIG